MHIFISNNSELSYATLTARTQSLMVENHKFSHTS